MARIHDLTRDFRSESRSRLESDPPSRPPAQTDQTRQTGQTRPARPTDPPPPIAENATVGVKSRLCTGSLRRSAPGRFGSPPSRHVLTPPIHSPADDDISAEVEDILYDLS